jgi:hypothetical protein
MQYAALAGGGSVIINVTICHNHHSLPGRTDRGGLAEASARNSKARDPKKLHEKCRVRSPLSVRARTDGRMGPAPRRRAEPRERPGHRPRERPIVRRGARPPACGAVTHHLRFNSQHWSMGLWPAPMGPGLQVLKRAVGCRGASPCRRAAVLRRILVPSGAPAHPSGRHEDHSEARLGLLLALQLRPSRRPCNHGVRISCTRGPAGRGSGLAWRIDCRQAPWWQTWCLGMSGSMISLDPETVCYLNYKLGRLCSDGPDPA